MAYSAFSELGGAAPHLHPVADPLPADDGRLSPLEWSVVSIARKDRIGSLRAPGRLARLLRGFFRQPNPRLADARLEALRRMAVLTWRFGYTVPSREVRALLAAGFTARQYETLVGSIDLARSRGRGPAATAA